MKIKTCFIAFAFFWSLLPMFHVNAQGMSDYYDSIEKKLTASPMTSSLGSYGGLDVKKNIGAVMKSIPLFEVQEGDLVYSPALEYFSTGIKIDDWGSRIGIGWTEKLTAVITREIRSVPDERATSRIGDNKHSLNEDSPTINDYNLVKTLSVNNTSVDGEYDIYTYNIFGDIGSFFIKGDSVIHLQNNNGVKIRIPQSVYKFIITDIQGNSFLFKEVETTKLYDQNQCDFNNAYRYNGSVTAWFLDKMVSPKGHTILFHYDPLTYNYLYDYTEFWTFSHSHTRTFYGPDFPCEDPHSGYKTSCFRDMTTATQLLTGIEGDSFFIDIEYVGRNDISNEKLLKKIVLHNRPGHAFEMLKEVTFNYEEVVSTHVLEESLQNDLQNDPWLHNAIKTRYYLSDVTIQNGSEKYGYSFSYLNPDLLPHRYSFSRDYFGCYNGKDNLGLIPGAALHSLNVPWEKSLSSMPHADREPHVLGMSGLLQSIKYPTGGKDSIVYEQNIHRVFERDTVRGTWSDWYTNSENSYSGALFDMYVPISGRVNLKISCYYDSDVPMEEPFEEYEARVRLMSHDGPIAFPDGTTWQNLHLDQVYNSTTGSGTSNNPVLSLYFETGNDYWLDVEIHGKHTALRVDLGHVESINSGFKNKTFVGYRVAKSISSSGEGLNTVKEYKYNVFEKADDKIVFTDNSSLEVKPYANFNAGWTHLCYEAIEESFWDHFQFYTLDEAINKYLPMHTLHQNPIYSSNVFNGSPYSYKHVTEIQYDEQDTSFVSWDYQVTQNNLAYRIMEYSASDFPVKGLTVDNSAWSSGLELFNYQGIVHNGEGLLHSERARKYKNQAQLYYNFSAYEFLPEVRISSSDAVQNLSKFIVKRYPLYSHWTTLDTVIEATYFWKEDIAQKVVTKRIYRYSPLDKRIGEEEELTSDGSVLLTQYLRPHDMVALDRDPNFVYQLMVNSHFLPEVQIIKRKNGSQISLSLTNFHRPFNGIYVPISLQYQRSESDPLLTAYHFSRYDERGNVLSMRKENGISVSYIWSYFGHYPVARIEGLSYSALESTIGNTNINNFFYMSPTKSEIEDFVFPLKQSYQNMNISLFTYEPYVGLKNFTDVKGTTTSYFYDELQRLKTITDHNNNLINSYQYHYRP